MLLVYLYVSERDTINLVLHILQFFTNYFTLNYRTSLCCFRWLLFLERTQIKMFLDPFGSTMFVCNKVSLFYFIFFIKLDFRIFQYSFASLHFTCIFFTSNIQYRDSQNKCANSIFFQGLTLSNRTCIQYNIFTSRNWNYF